MNCCAMAGKWTFTLTATLLVGALAAFAAPATPTVKSAPEGPLHEAMETMNGVMRRLRRSIGNEEKTAECLEQLQTFQVAAMSVKDKLPEKVTALEGAERDKMAKEFRLMMLSTIRASMAIEEALLKGDHAKAEELYKELGGMKKKGHDQFMDEEEDH